MRAAFLLPLLLPLLVGCPGGPSSDDYYRLEEGLVWEYALLGGDAADVWTLEIQAAEDNPQQRRGDLWVRLFRLVEDSLRPGEFVQVNQRSFNVLQEVDNSSQDAEVLGWTYRAVSSEEGDTNEYFVSLPEGGDWSDSWSYDLAVADVTWSHDVALEKSDEAVQTALGSYSDVVKVTRAVTSDRNDGSSPLTWLHEEFWALDVGLVRYRFTSSDDEIYDLALRTTNAFEI